MIHNLTEAEWSAIIAAVNLYQVDLDQNPENYVHMRPTAAQRLRALESGLTKVHQLAPKGA